MSTRDFEEEAKELLVDVSAEPFTSKKIELIEQALEESVTHFIENGDFYTADEVKEEFEHKFRDYTERIARVVEANVCDGCRENVRRALLIERLAPGVGIQ